MELIIAVLSLELAKVSRKFRQKADLNKKVGQYKTNKQKKSFLHIKMGKEISTFGDIEIEKKACNRYKSRIFLKRT